MAGSAGLSPFFKVLPFHMLRTAEVIQAIRPGDWFTSIDLNDAYYHISMGRRHRQFLQFAFEGQAFQFKVLPFRISLSPRVFTRCMQASLM